MYLPFNLMAMVAIAMVVSTINVNSAYIGKKTNKFINHSIKQKFTRNCSFFLSLNILESTGRPAGIIDPEYQQHGQSSSSEGHEVSKIKLEPPQYYRFCRRCRSPVAILFESGLQWSEQGRAKAAQRFPWLYRYYDY